MDWLDRYQGELNRLVSQPKLVTAQEEAVRDFLVDSILSVVSNIERDWAHALETRPYWIEAAPRPRGRQPRGTGIPWIEVAEYVPLTNITAGLGRQLGNKVEFPGLPTGSDLRFAYDDRVIHLDAKAAGPTDLHDEVVVSSNQLSGNGAIARQGKLSPEPSILNDVLSYPGRRKPGTFSPSLPPLYTYEDRVKLCITTFLKVVYDVNSPGDQPLNHMTLAIVPNGILLYDHAYAQTPNLFAAGKDDVSVSNDKQRVRVRFEPLLGIAKWRVTRFVRGTDGSWTTETWTP